MTAEGHAARAASIETVVHVSVRVYPVVYRCPCGRPVSAHVSFRCDESEMAVKRCKHCQGATVFWCVVVVDAVQLVRGVGAPGAALLGRRSLRIGATD